MRLHRPGAGWAWTTSASASPPCSASTRASRRGPRTDAFASSWRCRVLSMSDRSPLRVAIVDDESLARAVLREYLTPVSDIDIVAECANGFEAVKVVAELHPDLLFLDVQMPKLDGFEVLELVGRDVAVIFVTAYDQYAIRAFEVHAVDYLMKPFGADRLAAAMARARERLGRGERLPIRELT